MKNRALGPLWWMLIGFIAAVFLAVPAALIGYAVGGAVLGGVAVLGTLLLVQMPVVLLALRGTAFTLGKPPDEVP